MERKQAIDITDHLEDIDFEPWGPPAEGDFDPTLVLTQLFETDVRDLLTVADTHGCTIRLKAKHDKTYVTFYNELD